MLPVLVIFGFLVGFALDYYNFSGSFLTVLVLYSLHLTHNYRTQKKSINWEALDNDNKVKLEVELSIEKTMKYHLLSTITFLVSFAVSNIYMFNTHF
jgi:uncharacterized membrane protein (Fun14 family)